MTNATVNRVGPPPPHVIETDVQGDIGLYDARHERVLVLNRTASDVWLLCDGLHTLDEIIDLLARAYGTKPSAIRSDVETTLDRFLTEGFLPQW